MKLVVCMLSTIQININNELKAKSDQFSKILEPISIPYVS